MIRVKNYFPATIHIDGEPVRLRIKRLTREQWVTFSLEFERMKRATRGAELVLERRPGEEGLDVDDLEAKRWVEKTPEEREVAMQEEQREQERQAQFAVDTITDYVSAEPDQIFDEDAGAMVTSGADLVRVFAQRHDVLSTLVAEVFLENRLSADQKKVLRLLRDSARGSADSETAPGERPGPTAGNVGPEGSASPAAATDSPEPMASGMTESSS
jgi:hypothetical protein